MGGRLCCHTMTACAVLGVYEHVHAQVGGCLVQEGPQHGELGNCPQALSSGSSCLPGCEEGYVLDGPVSCDAGQLRMPSCVPSGCNVSEALDFLDVEIGDCPEILESGETCELQCPDEQELSDNVTCYLGNLSDFVCIPAGGWPCPAGHQVSTDSPATCVPCPLSTYKSGQGSWPCARCPPGSQTNGTGRTSAEACMCHDTYYELRDASNKLLSCIPCPNNSGVVGFHRHRHEDCRCWHGFVREPASEDERLQYCRPAEPCNVSDLSNLTGPEAYKLKMGSCEARANSSLLPDGLACSLACNAGFGAQLGSDIFRAVDLTLDCEDGTLVRRPPEGYLWCSEASWELPPLVFLGIATAATALGGAAIELRQHRLERRYAQALKPRPVPRPKRASSGASNDHSTGELLSLPNT